MSFRWPAGPSRSTLDYGTERPYSSGCDDGLAVELWTVNDVVHIPFLGNEFGADMIDWLFSKSR